MRPGPFLYPTSILLIKRQAHFFIYGTGTLFVPYIYFIDKTSSSCATTVSVCGAGGATSQAPFSPFCVMNYRICNMPMTRCEVLKQYIHIIFLMKNLY